MFLELWISPALCGGLERSAYFKMLINNYKNCFLTAEKKS